MRSIAAIALAVTGVVVLRGAPADAKLACKPHKCPTEAVIDAARAGKVDCWDVQKGGVPILKVEKNLFGGCDVRREDGTVERCELKASGETECRVVQQGRKQ